MKPVYQWPKKMRHLRKVQQIHMLYRHLPFVPRKPKPDRGVYCGYAWRAYSSGSRSAQMFPDGFGRHIIDYAKLGEAFDEQHCFIVHSHWQEETRRYEFRFIEDIEAYIRKLVAEEFEE